MNGPQPVVIDAALWARCEDVLRYSTDDHERGVARATMKRMRTEATKRRLAELPVERFSDGAHFDGHETPVPDVEPKRGKLRLLFGR